MTRRSDDTTGPQTGPRPVAPPPGALARPPRRAQPDSAAICLRKALKAQTNAERERFAWRGLEALSAAPDPELGALLQKQLYSACMAEGRFEEALEICEKILETGYLGDVARQDAARAALALGFPDVAAGHLEIAVRIAPDERKAFHWGTLGAVLRSVGRMSEAAAAFREAVEASHPGREFERLLYAAQAQMLDRPEEGRPALEALRGELEEFEESPGYRLWVLGELCEVLGDHGAGRRYMAEFLDRLRDAPPLKCLALREEIARAEAVVAAS